jgi:CheY-like chemotaxis protein
MNLCVNAMDAMPEGGRLTLQTRNLSEDKIVAQVIDTGAGMTREVLERSLDPFFTTKPVGKGTGLGLSSVLRAVQAHQGELAIQSEPGIGTSVRLVFPKYLRTEPAPTPPDTRHDKVTPKNLRIVLADDDDLVLASTKELLTALGHECLDDRRGGQLLDRIRRGTVADLIILDLNMPGLDGVETLKEIRTTLPSVPVILSTGRLDQNSWDFIRTDPNVSLLSKPFHIKELADHIERHCGTSQAGEAQGQDST